MESTQAPGRRWATWANGLTGLRLLAAPLLAAAILDGQPLYACGLYVLAVVTDLLDGRVARRLGESSPLGGLLDHAVDATFVTTGLAVLAWLGTIPALLPPLIAAAFVQYTADSRALRGQPLRTSALGRWNGIAYFVVLGVPVIRDALSLQAPGDAWVRGLGWLLVASTLISMAERAVALVRAR